MLIGTTKTRIVGTAVLALSAAALLAPTVGAKPTPRMDDQPNLLGSQLDRIVQSSADSLEGALRATEADSAVALNELYAELVQPPPDAFERAVAVRQAQRMRLAEIASRSANRTRHQPSTPQPSITGDGGGSFDWGLAGALSAVAAACLVLGGATIVFARQRGRTAHP
jgi:hypothetical protein